MAFHDPSPQFFAGLGTAFINARSIRLINAAQNQLVLCLDLRPVLLDVFEGNPDLAVCDAKLARDFGWRSLISKKIHDSIDGDSGPFQFGPPSPIDYPMLLRGGIDDVRDVLKVGLRWCIRPRDHGTPP